MAWHGIEGHDEVVEQFRRALKRGRLASSFLFTGPAGIGKRAFAMKLAQALLCETRPEQAMDPCGECPACVMVAAGTHPDIEVVSKPAEKSFIPVELFIGDREHRGREGLCHTIGLKPFRGGRKIALIDDADFLNAEGANSLLKTLEEPPPRSVLILIGTSPAKQLPTIRSRCQLIRFRPLAEETIARLLLSTGLVSDAAQATRLSGQGDGSVARAAELAEPELWEFRSTLLAQLAAPVLESVRFAPAMNAFIEAAGKEAPPRRARLRQVLAFALDFYQKLLHAQAGGTVSGDADLQRMIDEAVRRQPGDTSLTAARLDCCLEIAQQLDRNANQATLIETWLEGLAEPRGA